MEFIAKVDQFGSGLQKDLFLNELSSDCAIHVMTSNSNARFPCHRGILASVSTYFADILETLSEKDKGIITMKGIDPDVIFEVIRYVYLGYIHLRDWKTTTDILKVASKLKILDLVQQCEEYLLKRITLQNICYILEAALECNSEKLVKGSEFACSKAAFIILNTNYFRKLNLSTAQRILSIQDLHIRNEMEAFQAAWNWAIYRCCKNQKALSDVNITNEMSSLLECIGFQFMSHEELESVPQIALQKFYEMFPDMKHCNAEKKTVNEDLCHKQSDQKDAICNNGDLDTLPFVPIERHERGIYDIFPHLRRSKRKTVKKHLFHEQSVRGSAECKIRWPKQGRKLTFPLFLFEFRKLFDFDCDFSNDSCSIGNITLIRFSVNTPVYLETIDIKHHRNALSSNKCFSSFQVCNKNVTLATFSRKGSGNFQEHRASKCGRHFFDAMELLFLDAHEEYTIKINCDLQDGNLLWPVATVNNKLIDNLEINILSEKCFGISSISFIEAL